MYSLRKVVNRPVFLSYARKASRSEARSLYERLGGPEGPAFLDTEEIELGDHFPERLCDAVLGARLVVIFLTPDYFQRWYCIRELSLALSRFENLLSDPNATPEQRKNALGHIIVALPPANSDALLDHLPPLLRTTNWPSGTETERLAGIIRARLSTWENGTISPVQPRSIVAETLLEEAAIPPPGNLAIIPSYPQELSPSLGDGFFGRANELWRIHFALSTLRGAAGCAALTGSLEGGAGFGKTRLALEYVYRFGPKHYPGGVFWVNADTDDDRLEMQFHGILRVLRPEVPDLPHFREEKRDAHAELGQALEQASLKGAILMVADNIPEPPVGTPPKRLRTWCPVLGRVAMLATSRVTVSLESNEIRPMRIDVLPRSASVALLDRGLDRADSDREKLNRISAWVGDLPLALELLNRALRTGLELGELIQRVDDVGPTQELDYQMEALRAQIPEGALRGVTEALSISYERLSSEARKAARLIARLSPDVVPLELLNELGSDVSSAAVRAALLARSFITPVLSASIPVLGRMHRVLGDFLRSRSEDPRQESDLIGSVLLKLLPQGGFRDARDWPRYDALRPHAEQLVNDLISNRSQGNLQIATVLGGRVAELLLVQHATVSAETVLRRVGDFTEQTFGADDYGTLGLRNGLVEVIRMSGRHAEAREMGRIVLDKLERKFGSEDELTITALQNLALAEHEYGDHSTGIQHLRTAVASARKAFGDQDRHTLLSASNLARMLEIEGKYDESGSLFEWVLEIQRKTLGPDDSDTILTETGLAINQTNRGEHTRALVLHEDLLKKCIRLYGDNHPTTLTVRGHLAWTLHELGKNKESLKLLQRVVDDVREVLGPDHPYTLTAEGNLVLVLRSLGREEEAQSIEKSILERLLAVSGPEHPSTLIQLDNMAASFAVKGEWEKAIPLQQKVVEGLSAKLGLANRDTLVAMSNLAFSLHELGSFAEAAEWEHHAVDGCRSLYGDQHPDTIIAQITQARTLYDLNRETEANTLFTTVTENVMASAEEGATIALVIVPALLMFGRELQGRALLAGAKTLFDSAYLVSQKLVGDEHPLTLKSLTYLGRLLFAIGHLDDAYAMCESVLTLRLRTLGEYHEDTLESMTHLGTLLYQMGDYSAAYTWLKRAVKSLPSLAGGKDSGTTAAAWALFLTLNALGRAKEATELLRDHLLWLLNEDPSALDPSQQQIMALLYSYVQP